MPLATNKVWNLMYVLGNTDRIVGDANNPRARASAQEGAAKIGKRAVDGVPCALPCSMRQAMFGFSRQGSKAS